MTLPVSTLARSGDAALAERPTCLGCDRRRTDPDSLSCRPCRDRLARQLAYVADGYHRLDPTPVVTGGSGRGAPGFGSRSPARDDVLSLTDRRAVTHDPDRPGNAPSVVAALGWWADAARDAGVVSERDSARRSVAAECAALAAAVDDLARQWWYGDLTRAVATLAGHVRRALGEHEQAVPLGRCPQPAPGWEVARAELTAAVGPVMAARAGDVPQCDGEVFGTLAQRASCRECRTRWDGPGEVRGLAAQLGDAMLDLPGLARYLAVESTATLRSWAHRDRWRRERVNGRTLYALADARRSWWAAWDRAHPEHGPALPPGWPTR